MKLIKLMKIEALGEFTKDVLSDEDDMTNLLRLPNEESILRQSHNKIQNVNQTFSKV